MTDYAASPKDVHDQQRSVFDRLLGDWTVVREIPGYASATGVARIIPIDAETARYEESVRLSLIHGETLNGTQCYLYRQRPDVPLQIQILFCDTAELFQTLAFREEGRLWRATARFLCGADEYESEYRLDEQGWQVQHTVCGPRKNYRIETVYRKADDVGRARYNTGDGERAGNYFFNVR